MDTKVVTLPERTLAVQPTRDAGTPAPQAEAAAKLETANAIYWSPVVRIDNDTQTAVLQYLNPAGKVVSSFPHDLGSEAYAKAERQRRSDEAKASEPKPVDANQAPAQTPAQTAAPVAVTPAANAPTPTPAPTPAPSSVLA